MDQYTKIIKNLYTKIRHTNDLFSPLPEIYTRLSRIYVQENNIPKAIRLLIIVKDFISQRLMYSIFFGDLTIMKYLIHDIYQLIPFDADDISLFDLYYIFQNPAIVNLYIHGSCHQIIGQLKHDQVMIEMDGIYYENIDDFFQRATIKEGHISTSYRDVDLIEVLKRNG